MGRPRKRYTERRRPKVRFGLHPPIKDIISEAVLAGCKVEGLPSNNTVIDCPKLQLSFHSTANFRLAHNVRGALDSPNTQDIVAGYGCEIKKTVDDWDVFKCPHLAPQSVKRLFRALLEAP